MIAPWYLAAVCCIPSPNPKARLREREILRKVAADSKNIVKGTSRGRWDENKARIVVKDDREFGFTALVRSDLHWKGRN